MKQITTESRKILMMYNKMSNVLENFAKE